MSFVSLRDVRLKMKKLKRILKYVLIVLVILVIFILFPIFSYRKEVNDNPLGSYYRKGVYHMHSVFSDGRGTVDEITRAAAELDLDFVILTDHGRPNRGSSSATAYLNGVLLIGASEFSLHSGHLAAMGYEKPGYIFPPEPQEAINEVIRDQGVCFISHPFDDRIPWTDWHVKDFTGLEVLSCYSSASRVSFFKLLAFPLQYLVNANYALVSTLEYPEKNMEKWHSLNLENKGGCYYGIYALDAHAKLPVTENFQLNFPSYKAMFEILRVYVKIDNTRKTDAHQAAAMIIASLRKGNFFNVIEAIAPANGFESYFMEKSGRRVEMGGVTKSIKGKLVLHLPFEFETDVVILKNGKVFERFAKNRDKRREIEVKEPGFYGIEVYVSNNKFNRLPWIMTNPFFIGGKEPPALQEEKKEIVLKKPLAHEKEFFKVEKNKGSEGAISYGISDKDELITSLTFGLGRDSPSIKDFWSVLAVRERFDFSHYRGFVFEARADKRRRFWVEYRTGAPGNETWYRHSFLAEKDWKRFFIPFERFHVIFGEKKPPDLSDIYSIFFAINNANAYAGTRGRIDLKNIGLY